MCDFFFVSVLLLPFLHHRPPLCSFPLGYSSDDRVSEGAEEAAQSALPPADLPAAGGGDERPRARLPADESLQADDQGDESEEEEARKHLFGI